MHFYFKHLARDRTFLRWSQLRNASLILDFLNPNNSNPTSSSCYYFGCPVITLSNSIFRKVHLILNKKRKQRKKSSRVNLFARRVNHYLKKMRRRHREKVMHSHSILDRPYTLRTTVINLTRHITWGIRWFPRGTDSQTGSNSIPRYAIWFSMKNTYKVEKIQSAAG